MSNEFNIRKFLTESSTIKENPLLTIAAGAITDNALSADNEVEGQVPVCSPVLEKGSQCVVKDHVKKYGGATGKVICQMGDNYIVKIAGRRSNEVEFLEDELTASIDENFSGAFASAPVAENSAEEQEWDAAMGYEQDDPDEMIGSYDYIDDDGDVWDSEEEYEDYKHVHGTSRDNYNESSHSTPLSAKAISHFGDIASGGGDPIDHLITGMGYTMEDINAEAVAQGYLDANEWAGSYSINESALAEATSEGKSKSSEEEDLGDMSIDTIMPGDSVSVSKELGNEATVIAQRAGYIVVKLPAGGMKLLKDDEWWIDDADADVDYDDSEPEELQFEGKKKGDNTYSVHDGKNVIKTGITRNAAIKMAKEKGLEYGSAAHVQDKLNETTNVTDYNPKSPDGTRTEILAKIRKADKAGDANEVSRLKTAAQQAGATQKEMASEGRFGNDEGQPHMKHINKKREMDQELKGELGHREPTDAEMDAAAERNKKNPPFAKKTTEAHDNKSHSYTAGYNDGYGKDGQAPEFKTHWGPGGDDYQRGYADGSKEYTNMHRNAGLNEIETATDKLDKDRAPGESTTPVEPVEPVATQSAGDQMAGLQKAMTDIVANDSDMQAALAQAVNPDDQGETAQPELQGDEVDQLKNLLGLLK